ncbi:uncharacterized mitochondrial protein AtMg00810-like [Helianthus annuus]|uniref:uncharacterized mitochondrial protein AtMg00810-like n=1 Tax=Helianthus annuus TaxID=4232 RepID=UPI00165339A6|nr:uncharacterized mitochondrial protein AtMg00810-like [Helianthus annuus]
MSVEQGFIWSQTGTLGLVSLVEYISSFNGFAYSRVDTSLFIFKQHGCTMYLLVYVADLILTGYQEFAIKDLGKLSYFLGLEVVYTPNGLFLSQTKYVHDILERAVFLDSKPTYTSLSPNAPFVKDRVPYKDLTMYTSLLGALQYKDLTIASTAAEFVWISHLLRELRALFPNQPTLLCDNKNVIFLTQNSVSNK